MKTVKLIGAGILDEFAQSVLNEATLTVQNYLSEFAIDERLLTVVNSSFGNLFDAEKLENLRQQWAEQNFEAIPAIDIRPAADINGANGAFAAATNTIYLSQEYITQNSSNPQAITNILLEEIGHFVDAQINALDTPGDEGAIFSALVRGETLDEGRLQQLKAKDDTATVTLNGQVIQIEQADNQVTISGTILWTDSANKTRPVRGATVEIWDEDLVLDTYITTVFTDSQGRYQASFNNNDGVGQGKRDIYVKVFADGSAHFVEGERYIFGVTDTYTYSERSNTINEISDGASTINLPIGNSTDAERAFSISDALYVGEFYAKKVSVNLPVPATKLKVSFPADKTAYEVTNKYLKIEREYSLNWDAILHEYGHYLAKLDKLDRYTGSRHRAGTSNIDGDDTIPPYGKDDGTRLAWGEGLATYLALAVQCIAADAGLLPRVPGVDDESITIFREDMKTPIDIGVESSTGVGNRGEGDEASVFRILWDIADANQDTFISGLKDEIAEGHVKLYKDLQQIALKDPINNPLDRLDDVWDYFYGISTDTQRTKFGAIFEEYDVSPEPKKGKLIGKTFKVNESDPKKIPKFEWEVKNNGANDDFQVIIFNEDFSRRLVDTSRLVATEDSIIDFEKISTNTWTPTLEQWNRVTNNQGKYNFIVAGSDTTPGTTSDPTFVSTGAYWSSAYTFSVGPSIGLQPLKDGLGKTLAAIQKAVTDKIFGATGLQNISSLNGIPLLGNTLQTATGALFIQDLSTQISGKLSQKLTTGETASVDEIQEAFFELLGSTAINILKDSNSDGDITQEDIVYTRDGPLVKFNFKLGGKNTFDTSLPSEIGFGLPQLGLVLDKNKASVDLDYTFDFGFGIDTATNGFFFDTSPSKDLSILLKASLPDAKATLGFLEVDATKIGGKLDFSLNFEDGNDNKLKIGELDSLKVTPKGSADIGLNLLSSINGSKGLPRIGADLNVNWDFVENKAPTVAFNNVELGLGSFLSDFAGPILKDVREITRPVQPVIDILTKKIDLKVAKFSLLDLAEEFKVLDESDINFITEVANIITIVDRIDKISEAGGNVKIQLGSFNLGESADIRKPDFLLSSVEKPNIINPFNFTSADVQIAKGNDNEKQIGTLLKTPGERLKFPLLTEPVQAFNFLLGKDISLFTYDLPELDFKWDYSKFFPIVGPFGVRLTGLIGAKIDFAFGYDTKGLRDFSKSKDAADIFNGLYVSDRVNADGTGDDISEVMFNVGLEAAAEVNVGLASAGVGGGIYGEINFNLNDPDDNGKVYFDEIQYLIDKNPLYIFDTSGKVTAGLNAYFQVGFGFIKIKKRYDSPRRTLAEFNSKYDKTHDGSNGGTPPQNVPILATDIGSGVFRLNMGLNAAARAYGNITDEAEIFTIEHQSGSSGNEKVLISAFGTSKEYNGVSKIVANGGEQNDIIQVKDNVLTSAELAGGNGDDLIMGGSGNDSLEGNSGFDLLDGGNGNDTLRGGGDDDLLIGGAGADVLDGGSGDDTASYETATTGILLNLATGEATGDARGDTFVSIEQYEGSEYNDTLIGDATDNVLGGLGGNDLFSGGEGSDFLDGGDGDDTLHGDAGDDFLIGGAGVDVLDGSSGDDFLIGGAGADVLNGGAGIDTASYATATEGVLINLSTGEALGDALGDVLTSIEAIQGSSYEDILYGGSGADRIDGGSGDDNLVGVDGNDILLGSSGIDFLSGGNGNDYLQGDSGNDILRGGAGSDTFAFATGASFNINELGVDTINDFTPGLSGDKIQLSKYTFTALNNSIFPTALNSADFATVTNDSLAEGSDRKIVYNSVNGNLFYNPNGSTAGFADALNGGGRFATLTASSTPALTSDSFEVVL